MFGSGVRLELGGRFRGVGIDSVRALQAGLASLLFLFTTLATFGPWFSLPLAIALTGASVASGFAGVYWSHRATHSARRHPWELGRVYGRVGWFASLIGIIVSASLNGLVFIALHPLGWIVAIVLILAFLAIHAGTGTKEELFLARLNPVQRTAACVVCGRRALVAGGHWRRVGWTCVACAPRRHHQVVHKILRASVILCFVGFTVLATAGQRSLAFCEILELASDVPTEVRGTQVEIGLTEGFARIVIIKEFFNPSDRLKEGQVFFPLEKGHELITDLSLKIGNVVYHSSASDRQEGLDDFLGALANGKDAALVQYDPARDVYWIAVTIPPKESRTTVTTLEMPLTKRDGLYEYDYRLSVDARQSTQYLRLHATVQTSAPLETVQVPSHPGLAFSRRGMNAAEAWINSTEEAGGRDLTIQFRSLGPSIGQQVVTRTVDDATVQERYVRFSVDVRDPAFAGSLRPLPRSFLFLVDASGSMGISNRWSLASDAVLRLGQSLGPGESYAIAAFQGKKVITQSDVPHQWTRDSEGEVARFLESIHPAGSTSLTVAVPTAERWARDAAAGGQQPILFLLTDGRPTIETQSADVEKPYNQISHHAQLPVFALAMKPSDHSDENLLRNVSHFNDGEFLAVSDGGVESAVRQVVGAIRVPVLESVKTAFTGGEGIVFASPNTQVVIQGGEVVAVAKMSGGATDPLSLDVSGSGPAGDERFLTRDYASGEIPLQPLLRKQWVLFRVHALLEEIEATGDPATVAELKAFATANRIVTPYTSLVVTIPRTNPGTPATEGSTAFDLAGFDPFGGGLLTGPGSAPQGLQGPGSTSTAAAPPFAFTTPLDQQARDARAYWDDVGNDLSVEHEVDRYVRAGSPEHRSLDLESAVPRFQGRDLTIVETGGELIGIYSGRLDPSNGLASILWNVLWGAFASATLWIIVEIQKSARRKSGGSVLRSRTFIKTT